jgi:hypothetical protein
MTSSGKRVYCTYFDHRYLSRGLSLIASLRRVGDHGRVWVLCLSETAYEQLQRLDLPGVHPLRLADLEAAYPAVAAVKDERTTAEYYFTWTPWWMQHVLDASPDAEWVTYLDADLWFFSSTDAIYDELAGASVGIVPHRFSAGQEWRLKYGTYNVGWVSFRNDESGRACLRWWSERCAEWCKDVPEDGRFADQGYLDSFAQVTDSLRVITNPGANLAPWNLRTHAVDARPSGVTVDGHELVFFHFHGVDRSGDRFYLKHAPYGVRTTATLREYLYRPYLRDLLHHENLTSLDEDTAVVGRRASRAAAFMTGRRQLIRVAARLRGDSLRLP